MAHCHETKPGEIYYCGNCGMEIQILKTCEDSDACVCADPIECCGMPLKKKEG